MIHRLLILWWFSEVIIMAIILDSEMKNDDFEIKHDKKLGYYKDYSKYFYENKNMGSKIIEKKQNINQYDNVILNKVLHSKIDKTTNLNIPTQKIYYNDIYYQKNDYGNSISLGVMN